MTNTKSEPRGWMDKSVHVHFVQSGKSFMNIPAGRVFLPEWLKLVIIKLAAERKVDIATIANRDFYEALRWSVYFEMEA